MPALEAYGGSDGGPAKQPQQPQQQAQRTLSHDIYKADDLAAQHDGEVQAWQLEGDNLSSQENLANSSSPLDLPREWSDVIADQTSKAVPATLSTNAAAMAEEPSAAVSERQQPKEAPLMHKLSEVPCPALPLPALTSSIVRLWLHVTHDESTWILAVWQMTPADLVEST